MRPVESAEQAVRILLGDCRERLSELPESSVDSIVCDPPYELGFMGKSWDASGIAYSLDVWKAAFRALKPGGHLLAFSGTRTYHRMVVAIEDAGFEIRDQLAWVYGSGFPKSHDVAQSIEKLQTTGKARRPDRDLGGLPRNRFSGSVEGKLIADTGGKVELTTEAAKQWQGWGTALKPAWEPICLARKPLVGTVATNVLEHGTGAINIDGCRVETDETITNHARSAESAKSKGIYGDSCAQETHQTTGQALGRWPANLCHDGSDEVVEHFPSKAGAAAPVKGTEPSGVTNNTYGKFNARVPGTFFADSGSAARFFYCAKTSKSERGEGNDHPTVKPQALMRWLCRLITPPGGVVLDPFLGSGSTGLASMSEGFRFIGIELNDNYADIARRRLGLDLA